ncbi:MAG: class I SAM-dependent methyltransferase [Thermomicrobiales bacterium]
MSSADTGVRTTNPERIVQTFLGYQLTAILKAAIQLGVFDQVAEGKRDPASVARGIDADERGTSILLEALAATGFLEGISGDYCLPPDVEKFLVRAQPSFIGDVGKVWVSEWNWANFGHLADSVRAGGSVAEKRVDSADHPFWQVFVRDWQAAASPAAEAVASKLSVWASSRRDFRALDLACGGGLFAIALVQRVTQARVVLLDTPEVLSVTRGYVTEAGLMNRAEFIEGDMFSVDLGGPYDLVLASFVFHHFGREACLALLRRLRAAMNPGGRIAIHEFAAMGRDASAEPVPRLFSALMLVNTEHGQAYSLVDYEQMLAETGFTRPETHELSGQPSRLLVADRVD